MSGLARLTPGTIFAGDFRVEKPLGEGGMGSVYVAVQLSTGHKRVLKLMHAHLAEDEDQRRRFTQEARVGARIASDHVVQVIAAGIDEESSTPWLAMELLDGEDLLSARQRRGLLPMREVLEIVAQLRHALAAAHAAGVVHRDLKPENLFLGASRREESALTLKVLDFGIAKVLSDATAPAATAPIGTLAWMAPEQADPSGVVTPRTDVWAMGLIAYWLLTGKSYWRSLEGRGGGSAAKVLREVLFDDLLPASERAAASGAAARIPPGFDAWFARAVAREPMDRFADGGEAGAELEALLREALLRDVDGLMDTATGAPSDPLVQRRAEAMTEPAPGSARTLAVTRTAPVVRSKPDASSKIEAIVAPPAKRPSRVGRIAIIAGAIAVIAFAAQRRWWAVPSPSPSASVSASPSASAAPRPTPITDLPPPVSRSPDALAAYAAALQAIRDANYAQAQQRLEQAVAMDPSFAAAHMRLFMLIQDDGARRAAYAHAEEGRTTLGERDRGLLKAMEASLGEPADRALVAARLRELSARFPMDAELPTLLAVYEPEPPAALRIIGRALELDPESADVWQTKAWLLAMAGQPNESLDALGRCLALSPLSSVCRQDRARALSGLGRCEEMSDDLDRALSLNPKEVSLLEERAELLQALGRPPEAVLEALGHKWAVTPEPARRAAELLDRTLLAFSRGDFQLAEEHTRAVLAAAAGNPDAEMQFAPTFLLVQIHRETGRDRDAALAADEHLKRAAAFRGRKAGIETISMLRTMVHGGLLSKEAFAEQRDAWLVRMRKRTPPFSQLELWMLGHALGVNRADEATESIAALPKNVSLRDLAPREIAFVAHVHLLAGKPAEALALMRDAMKPCKAVKTDPRAAWILGRALEDTGDKPAACASYSRVIDRWGKAKPRSITADDAKRRVKALGCP